MGKGSLTVMASHGLLLRVYPGWMQWRSTREPQHIHEHIVSVSELGMLSSPEVLRRRAVACLSVIGGRHGIGAIKVEQVRDAAQHRLLRARAPAAPEVVQPAACVDSLHFSLQARDARSICWLGAEYALWEPIRGTGINAVLGVTNYLLAPTTVLFAPKTPFIVLHHAMP